MGPVVRGPRGVVPLGRAVPIAVARAFGTVVVRAGVAARMRAVAVHVPLVLALAPGVVRPVVSPSKSVVPRAWMGTLGFSLRSPMGTVRVRTMGRPVLAGGVVAAGLSWVSSRAMAGVTVAPGMFERP